MNIGENIYNEYNKGIPSNWCTSKNLKCISKTIEERQA